MPSRSRSRARTLLVLAVLSMSVPTGVALAASTGGSSAGSSSGSSAKKSQTLQLGSKGSAVKQLQRVLNVSPVSGYYGSQTKAAVKRFQKRRGLKADGIAGPATLRALGIRVKQSSYATGGSAPSSSSSSNGRSSGPGGHLPRPLHKNPHWQTGGEPPPGARRRP